LSGGSTFMYTSFGDPSLLVETKPIGSSTLSPCKVLTSALLQANDVFASFFIGDPNNISHTDMVGVVTGVRPASFGDDFFDAELPAIKFWTCFTNLDAILYTIWTCFTNLDAILYTKKQVHVDKCG
jgi:hypothetical protein